jgi:hypothetical protein
MFKNLIFVCTLAVFLFQACTKKELSPDRLLHGSWKLSNIGVEANEKDILLVNKETLADHRNSVFEFKEDNTCVFNNESSNYTYDPSTGELLIVRDEYLLNLSTEIVGQNLKLRWVNISEKDLQKENIGINSEIGQSMMYILFLIEGFSESDSDKLDAAKSFRIYQEFEKQNID